MKQHILISVLLGWSFISSAETITVPDLKWTGDLRVRALQAAEADDDRRYYQQIRARLGVGADVNESMRLVFRLATGTSPVSTNQQLGKDPGMVRRSFGIDLAYMDWKFGEAAKIWLGRTPNPFWSPAKVQTVFDADLTFEGVAFKLEPQWSDSSMFINLGAFIVAENYSAPDDLADSALIGADAGYRAKAGAWSWAAHAGTFHYLNVKDKTITSIQAGAGVDAYSAPFTSYRGNSVYVSGATHRFENEYTLAVVGGEAKTKIADVIEIGPFVEIAKNYAVGSKGLATEAGLAGKWKDLAVSVARIDKEADSVFAAFSDSDTNGGGSDNAGYRLQLSYQIAKNCSFTGTHYVADRGVDTTMRDYDSTHLDLVAGF